MFYDSDFLNIKPRHIIGALFLFIFIGLFLHSYSVSKENSHKWLEAQNKLRACGSDCRVMVVNKREFELLLELKYRLKTDCYGKKGFGDKGVACE